MYFLNFIICKRACLVWIFWNLSSNEPLVSIVNGRKLETQEKNCVCPAQMKRERGIKITNVDASSLLLSIVEGNAQIYRKFC
jgi:hypothetical protein